MRATAFPTNGATATEAAAAGVGGRSLSRAEVALRALVNIDETMRAVLLELKVRGAGFTAEPQRAQRKAGIEGVERAIDERAFKSAVHGAPPPAPPGSPARPAPPIDRPRTDTQSAPPAAAPADIPEPTRQVHSVAVIDDAPSNVELLEGWLAKLTPSQLDVAWVGIVIDLIYTQRHTKSGELPPAPLMTRVLSLVRESYRLSQRGGGGDGPIEREDVSGLSLPREIALARRSGGVMTAATAANWRALLAAIPNVGDRVRVQELFPTNSDAKRRVLDIAQARPNEFRVFRENVGAGASPFFVERIAPAQGPTPEQAPMPEQAPKFDPEATSRVVPTIERDLAQRFEPRLTYLDRHLATLRAALPEIGSVVALKDLWPKNPVACVAVKRRLETNQTGEFRVFTRQGMPGIRGSTHIERIGWEPGTTAEASNG